jgi:hypothetical protein
MELAVAQEHMKTLEYKIELLNHKFPVPIADSECWKPKYRRIVGGTWIYEIYENPNVP